MKRTLFAALNKRIARVTVIAMGTAQLAVLASALVVSAGPTCGTNEPELRLYSGPSQSGTMLGALCASVRPGGTIGLDENMGDSFDTYRGSDNDNAESFKFYNPTSSVWCVVMWYHADFTTIGKAYALGPTDTWWGPSGGSMGLFDNDASSVQIYRRSSYESGTTCNGI